MGYEMDRLWETGEVRGQTNFPCPGRGRRGRGVIGGRRRLMAFLPIWDPWFYLVQTEHSRTCEPGRGAGQRSPGREKGLCHWATEQFTWDENKGAPSQTSQGLQAPRDPR